jgi:hypothetical protein
MNRRCKKLKSEPSVNMSFSELIAQRDANAAEPKLQERKQEKAKTKASRATKEIGPLESSRKAFRDLGRTRRKLVVLTQT